MRHPGSPAIAVAATAVKPRSAALAVSTAAVAPGSSASAVCWQGTPRETPFTWAGRYHRRIGWPGASVVGADSGQPAAPILWSDNYVSLVPGERRQIHGEIPTHALGGEAPVFRYSGWNVTGE